jgi:hypothetical protein
MSEFGIIYGVIHLISFIILSFMLGVSYGNVENPTEENKESLTWAFWTSVFLAPLVLPIAIGFSISSVFKK